MDLIEKYFPELEAKKKNLLAEFAAEILNWNAKINLISRKDTEFIYIRHILHSLSIAHYFQFRDGCSIADIGTGGGFPGIPLAIYFDRVDFTLVDSVAKKVRTVRNIAERLGLHNVRVIQSRSEDLKGKFDFVVARAVASLPDFYRQTKHLIPETGSQSISRGIIYLKGGAFEKELEALGRATKVITLKTYFIEEYFNTKKMVFIPF